jgi:acetyl-CoA carboxylase biotin carboxyl carrier protein
MAKKPVPAKDKSQTNSEMKTSEIRDLIDFIAQSGLNEVNIETKEIKLHVKREPDQKVMKSSGQVMTTQPVGIQAPQITQQQTTALAAKNEKAAVSKGLEIKSPMIGTFYRSSNPDSPPFVSARQ